MHLKSLTVRGFKSFASATTFDFEPGVTAVVGPNGSGKSNVVDALAWVMGEQGAKSLRGGKMEDVIFAGTSARPALGRAHVSLTIDNTDGALPIEYTEVTVSRTLFRSGGSEYAINGRSCRLLDIQELLSDSGLGREMHVIVGQGQLDRILQATPEERRGFIEEASGILKHRRRKEKTLRKLDSVQANLDRLEDLVGEIQRQLTPLGRQARTARKAQRIQYEVRDARARLLADDLVAARTALHRHDHDAERTRQRKTELETQLARIEHRVRETEVEAARTDPVLHAARTSWYELSTARDALRALASLAAERRRLLGSTVEPDGHGADVERLDEQARHAREQAEQLAERVEDARAQLETATAQRTDAETTAREAEQHAAGLVRAAADRRAGAAKLAAAVSAARSALGSAEGDVQRLRGELTDVAQRVDLARGDLERLTEAARASGERARTAATTAHEAHEAAELARTEAARAEAARHEVLREHDSLAVRLDTWRQAVPQPDGSEVVSSAYPDAVLGAVSRDVRVAGGWERAVAAALGPWAEALAVTGHTRAAAVFDELRAQDAGRVSVLVAAPGTPAIDDDTAGSAELSAHVSLPSGALPAAAAVEPVDTANQTAVRVARAVRALVSRTVLVEDAASALTVLDAASAAGVAGVTAITRGGDRFGAHSAQGGAAEAAGGLELRSRIERGSVELEELAARLQHATDDARAAATARDEALERSQTAAQRSREAAREASEAENALGRAEAVTGSADAELERRRDALATAQQRCAERERALGEARERAEHGNERDEDQDEREQLEAAAARERAESAARAAREAETQAKLALRGLEEQHRHALSRAEAQQRAARAERLARAEAARRAERRRAQAAVAQAVSVAGEYVRERAAHSVELAARERDEAETRRAGLDEAAGRLRRERDDLARSVAETTEQLHREELALTGERGRLESLETSSLEDLGLTPEHLVDNYGPHLPVPDTDTVFAQQDQPAATDDAVPGQPFVREEQQARLTRAEKQLRALGKVNPLALEEFAALEERHRFLAEQLEDVKNSRTDLRNIIRQVDEHVERVFTQAWHDTAEQFVQVFATLFPGGEGRLRLTDPDDMLTTGVDVEARPAGKKVKRLSLLSGGERSLTALALLIAIFKARPSPFYVMDEVEAALDDRNLGRLLTIFRQLQESSQLIIVTHQKRTMEIADALYGVSMRGDGVSLVVGQKLAELR